MTKWRFSHDMAGRLFPAGACQESTGLSITDLSKIIGELEGRGMVEVAKERKNRPGFVSPAIGLEGVDIKTRNHWLET